MKGEIKLYLGICLIISALFLYQKSDIHNGWNSSISEVNSLDAFNQLLVDVECNLYLIEGEEEGILLEGPVSRLTGLETNFSNGCISVREKSKRLLSEIWDIFITGKPELNIYVTVNDISKLNILPSLTSPEIKYKDNEVIGVFVKKGERLIIESGKVKSCIS